MEIKGNNASIKIDFINKHNKHDNHVKRFKCETCGTILKNMIIFPFAEPGRNVGKYCPICDEDLSTMDIIKRNNKYQLLKKSGI